MSIHATVVIPARDAAADLATSLPALVNSKLETRNSKLRPLEVIVADDGSADATAAVAESYGARVVRVPRLGPAAARNAGAHAASGDILVFLDADCTPAPGCLQALLAPFADPSVAGVRGGYASSQRGRIARFVQLEMEEKQARLAASSEIAVVDTACAAYRRALFLQVGGFDEHFPPTSAEDVELSFRLAAQGARLVYAPGALVRHRHVERLVPYLWRKLRFGFYRAAVYGRYPGRMGGEDGYTPRLMPLQIGLAGVISAAIGLSPWLPSRGPAMAAAGMAFIATTLPLTARAWRTDRPLAPLVPPLLFARSLAQGFGLVAGFGALALARLGMMRHPLGQGPPLPHPSSASGQAPPPHGGRG